MPLAGNQSSVCVGSLLSLSHSQIYFKKEKEKEMNYDPSLQLNSLFSLPSHLPYVVLPGIRPFVCLPLWDVWACKVPLWEGLTGQGKGQQKGPENMQL